MIEKLYVKDFAIINEIEILFSKGFTVITGETGSGKSILLQALNISLGAKPSKTMVRSKSERAIVETVVDLKIFRRIINKSGRTKSFANDEPCNENTLRSFCGSLVDFHGQHEQQYIMNIASHIDYLDAFCGIADRVEECAKSFESIKKNSKLLNDLIQKKQSAEQQQELLSFQLNEILVINPIQGEDVELEDELHKIKHLDELVETSNRLTRELTYNDESIYDKISSIIIAIEKLISIDQQFEKFSDLIQSATINIQDASNGINDYVNTINYDKNTLIEIQERLGDLDNLKRKYGGSINSVLNTKTQIEESVSNFSSLDSDIVKVQKKIKNEKGVFLLIAQELHTKRLQGAKLLSKKVEAEMAKLNMPAAQFNIQIDQKADGGSFAVIDGREVQINQKGVDNVQFLLSANPGERLKPLVEIASGGEISRIMLAIKTVFQDNDPVDSLIFDEIDSGISGAAAEKVADSLANLAKTKQVICITHLPQIVNRSDNHLHITKSVKDGKTIVSAKYLNNTMSKQTIKMLSNAT